ncbi:MAG: hypothetical protein UW95_C0023G0011 [Parcubacteria group bacterium GW2011_GWC1_45_14]|nr:MAG: hypothetical protein UW87_C0012G0012 [Candidatus Moranbacteria bacterium GW2011_GWC2_45_10]KKT93415.1 MAG: hypothetical protein UW95_C0023G0011 [Parcubacteria group bacterium GW2011_GWC1_45_14]
MDKIQKNYSGHFISMLAYGALVFIAISILYSLGKIGTKIPSFDLVILGLATFRLTHLFVYDMVTDYIRDYFGKFERGAGKTLSELLNCPWCTGVWAALFIGFFYLLTPLAFYPIFFVALAGIGSIFQIISIYIVRLTPSQYKKEIEG